MFRIRAVESPPDAGGVRRIWHRGRRGAELLTLVDARGRVVQQDFTLFDDIVRWHKDLGFRHSRVEPGTPHDAVPRFTRAADEPLAHFRGAVETYSGSDRFIQHLRDQLSGRTDALGTGEAPRSSAEPEIIAEVEPAKDSSPRSAWLLLAILTTSLLVGLGLVALWRR